MKPRRKTFPAIARLSRAAHAIMQAAFLEGPGVRSAKSIVEEIRDKTKEHIDDNAVYRYQDHWLTVERSFIEARKEADGMLAALRDHPTADAEELIRQRLMVAQVLTAKRFDESDPVELGYLAQGEKRIALEKEKIAVSKDKLGLERQKVEALQRQIDMKQRALDAAKEKAEGAAKSIEALGKRKGLDAETLKKIREEVYGIVEAPV